VTKASLNARLLGAGHKKCKVCSRQTANLLQSVVCHVSTLWTCKGCFRVQFGLVYCCLTALSAQIGYIVPQKYKCSAGEQHNHTIDSEKDRINQENHTHSSVRPRLFGDDPLATVRLSQSSLSSQSLGKYRTDLTVLTRTTKRQNTYQRKLTIHKKVP